MQIPSIVCPLCREKNIAFENQRCQHCKMLMMSDADFHVQHTAIKPLMEEVSAKLEKNNYLHVQPLLDQLAPYQADHNFVQEYLQGVSKIIHPYIHFGKLKMMFRLNILIAVILIVIPFSGILIGIPNMIIGLLLMPALTWFWIGIIMFRKKMRKFSQNLA